MCLYALPEEANDVVEGEADADGVTADDSEGADPGSEQPEPISSRLRSRVRAARTQVSNQGPRDQTQLAHVVENNNENLSHQLALPGHDRELFNAGPHLVLCSCRNCIHWKLLEMSGRSCNCTCVLIAYSCLATVLVIGLSAILGHQSQVTCNLDPSIVDNTGEVAVMSEMVYNVDVFNSHSETKEKTEESGDGTCEKTCAHYFTGLQVGELISFVLLGCLTVRYWGEITLWCHSQCQDFRRTAKVKKRAKEAEKKKSLKAELEMEMAAAAQSGSSGMPNQTGQNAEAAGGGVQAGRESGAKKADSVSVNFCN